MRALAALSLLLLATPLASAQGQDLCERHSSTTAMDEMERAFIGAVQIGDGDGSKDWELRVGKTESDKGPAGSTADYVWTSGENVPFRFAWSPTDQQVTLELDGVRVSRAVTAAGQDVWDLFVRARATGSAGATWAGNFTLDGFAVQKGVRAPVHDSFEELLHLGPPDVLSDGFVLTGNVTLSWTGSPPQKSRLSVEFIAGKTPMSCFVPGMPVPELSSLLLAAAGLGVLGIVLVRRRKSDAR